MKSVISVRNRRVLRGTVMAAWFLSSFILLMSTVPVTASDSGAVTIDPNIRTVTTSNFFVAWNTGKDVEAITTLRWAGGQNLTNPWALDTCAPAFPGTIEYFGDSFAPPDPWLGGLALVGGGTTTPPGTTAWSGQILPSGTAQVTINSASTGCPHSAGINVKTTYSFFNPNDPSTTWFGVQRDFDFRTTTFAHDFRPYMPRLRLSEGFTQVLYPTTSDTLATLNVFDCGYGCTGPAVVAYAALLNPPWDATQGWFAMHNPATLQGVIVKRNPSVDPQENLVTAQLWVDNDASSYTNSSSFLLMSPTGGFTGGLVTEVETFCFYDSSIWTPSLTPPAACSSGIPFSSFSGKLELDPDAGSFDLNAAFKLGPGGNINPATESVSLTIGTYSVTIPPGSFARHKPGYAFEGTTNGAFLDVLIKFGPTPGTYRLLAEGRGANLTGTTNPVTVTLNIGSNTGSTNINAEFE